MIIYNYLSRQLLFATVSVGFLLVTVLASGRFVKYLAEALDGRLSGDLILAIMVYRLPGFLELILPLSLFIGVLLAYGRLYLDNEMTVLSACGISGSQLIGFTLIPALSMSLVVAVLSLYISPKSNERVHYIWTEQETKSDIDLISPGKFYTSKSLDMDRTTYVKEIDTKHNLPKEVFISEFHKKDNSMVTITAKYGEKSSDPETGAQYLILYEGYRFQADAGVQVMQSTQFAKYTVMLKRPTALSVLYKINAWPSKDLLATNFAGAIAELHWRIALPIMCFIMVLLAIPLSKVSPRQGRYFKLLPAILLYMTYLSLLIGSKNWLFSGAIPMWMGMWWVHGIFLVLAVLLNVQGGNITGRFRKHPVTKP